MGHDTWADRDFAGRRPSDEFNPIRADLAEGERIVWEGQPQLGPLALRSVPLALVGIPVGGFALIWIAMAYQITSEAPFPLAKVFPLFGLPVLLVGAGMLLAPAWAAWRGSRTWYAITDRRAIIAEPQLAAGVQTRSYRADALGNVVRNQRGDGSGDLVFEEIQTIGPKGRLRITQRGFFAVADVRRVEALLGETLLSRRVAP